VIGKRLAAVLGEAQAGDEPVAPTLA
jgi:hypothetical protein